MRSVLDVSRKGFAITATTTANVTAKKTTTSVGNVTVKKTLMLVSHVDVKKTTMIVSHVAEAARASKMRTVSVERRWSL